MDGREIKRMANWMAGKKMRRFLEENVPWISTADAISECCVAAVVSSKTFDESMKTHDRSEGQYALRAMRWQILSLASRKAYEPFQQLDNPRSIVGQHVDFDQDMNRDDERRILKLAIRHSLPASRERNMFLLRKLDGLPLRSVASMYGITRERVRQITDRAERKVREWILTNQRTVEPHTTPRQPLWHRTGAPATVRC